MFTTLIITIFITAVCCLLLRALASSPALPMKPVKIGEVEFLPSLGALRKESSPALSAKSRTVAVVFLGARAFLPALSVLHLSKCTVVF